MSVEARKLRNENQKKKSFTRSKNRGCTIFKGSAYCVTPPVATLTFSKLLRLV
jgi:hypothetical protein